MRIITYILHFLGFWGITALAIPGIKNLLQNETDETSQIIPEATNLFKKLFLCFKLT